MTRFKVEVLSKNDWRATVASHPNHSFFSRPEWYEVFEKVFPGRFQSLFLRCYNNDKEVLLPCMKEMSRFRLRSLVSSPMGGTSDFFSSATVTSSDLDSISGSLIDQCDVHQVVLKPSPLIDLGDLPENKTIGSTHLLDLKPDYSEIAANYLHKTRKNLAKAQRTGLSVSLGQREDILVFYRMMRVLYEERFKKSPEVVLPLRFYEQLFDIGDVDLLIVRQSPTEEIISATICLHSTYEYFQLHNATNYSFAGVRPNDLWEDFAVKRGKSLGAQYLNFGASPSDGVERFKESFGAKKKPVAVFRRERAWAQCISFMQGGKKWMRLNFGKSALSIRG